jgi:hypothetical protein
MKFGGLSEKEVSKITFILNDENIPFTIDKDQEIEEFNTASMKNDLRHYTPPSISTHILAININDEDFQSISTEARARLLEFGISDQVPEPEDFVPQSGASIHKELLDGPRRMVAFNMKHQLIVGAIILLGFWIFGKL